MSSTGLTEVHPSAIDAAGHLARWQEAPYPAGRRMGVSQFRDGGSSALTNVLSLLLSVFAASTAAIMIVASTTHPVLLASLRLFVAAPILLPLFLRDLRRHRECLHPTHLQASIVPGPMLAIHSCPGVGAV